MFCFAALRAQANVGVVRSSNLCAEITEVSDASTYAVCNLASIAVNHFADAAAGGVDHARLHAVAKMVTRNLNRIIDINGYPTPETARSNLAMRPIGIGIQVSDLLRRWRASQITVAGALRRSRWLLGAVFCLGGQL